METIRQKYLALAKEAEARARDALTQELRNYWRAIAQCYRDLSGTFSS